MKIAIDVQPLQTPGSKNRGVGVYVGELITSMLEIDHANEYVFFANRNYDEPSLLRGKEVVRLPFPDNNHAIAETLYEVALLSGNIDVLHLTGNPLEISDLVIPDVGPTFPIKVVWSAYDLIPYLYPQHYLNDNRTREVYLGTLETDG